MKKVLLYFCVVLLVTSCKDESPTPIDPIEEKAYFPPTNGNWETTDPASLGWDTSKLPALYQLLENNDSRAFLLIKDGKIVVEKYWGLDILQTGAFTKESEWYWASAAKTLTAFTVGKAAEEGFLDITDKSSDYLGENWTSLTKAQQDKITVWHQLTMTTGLDDETGNVDDTSAAGLIYKADAGTRWAYHNGPYTLLDLVVESAVGEEFEPYFNEKLRDPIGMGGFWLWNTSAQHLYFSTPRSMARYGILMLNDGVWDGNTLLNSDYINAMRTPSQTINNAYGYLWWLNGSTNFMLPQSQAVFPGSMVPDAPADMYSAMGKNGQYLCVVPSENLVMIRMGDNPTNAPVPLLFVQDIWSQLKDIL